MTINTTTARADYAGNGVTTEFPVPFVFFGLDEIQVIERDQVTGIEVTLIRGAAFTVSGGGGFEGTVTATPAPPAGKQWTIRRTTAPLQQTDFSRNDTFPSESVERALDRVTAVVQETLLLNERTIRVPLSDPGTGLVLPANVQRANRILGFDSSGAPLALPPTDQSGTAVVPAGSVTPRLLAEHLRAADPRNWGGIGNGLADDTAALQAAATFATANGLVWFVPEGTWRTTGTVTLGGAAAGALMQGTIRYDGAGSEPALVIGDATVRAQAKRYAGLRVSRATLASWTNEADIGLLLRNLDACDVDIRRVERFTIGVRTQGSGVPGSAAGFEDTNITLGRLIDCRYALDVHCAQPAPNAWNNSVRYFGGHFANSSSTHPTLSRFGVRFSAAPGAYDLHNAHVFYGPAFELQRQGTPGTVDAIPFLAEVKGRAVVAHGVRMEGCSPFVARHTDEMNDCEYDVIFVGTFAYTGAAIDYPSTATRAGGTSRPTHQARAAHASPRVVALAESVRPRAFRFTAGTVGFEGMGLIASSPGGSPVGLNTYVFGGLDDVGLLADEVALPTTRALGFVVRTDICREFFIAADGVELRPVVQQFGAGEGILTSPGARALFSNMDTNWIGAPSNWWQGNGFLDSLSGGLPLNRLQRVTLDAACLFAFIGVRGNGAPGGATSRLRGLSLFCAPEFTPAAVWGDSRRWGSREVSGVSLGYDVPSIAAGGTFNFNVACVGARPGDFAQASFGLATTLPFSAMAQSDQINVRVSNPTGAAVDLAPADVFVRAVKPRV